MDKAVEVIIEEVEELEEMVLTTRENFVLR